MPIYKCESSSVNPQTFPLDEIVMGLREARFKWRADQNRLKEMGGRHLPSPHTINEALELVIGALFPMRLGPNDLLQENEDFYVGHTIGVALNTLLTQVRLEVRHQHRNDSADPAGLEEKAVGIVREFARKLPGVRRLLDTDVYAAYSGDPAAKSVDEVLLCYPGVLAMVYHRLAHCLYTLGVPLVARIAAELAHGQTGIDIHPGAQIGAGFFIDHGTGVVIGETAIIGERVRLYQNVTLGAKSFPTESNGDLSKGIARHPIVEDDVVIYAGATVLGRVTIGKGAVVGGNVWLTHDVAPGCFVRQASASNKEALFNGNCD
ncbi:serine O-acetyltransferase [Advenella incenata]|jgi:serine O-acetyltransferase|uniref:serine O-acetyltransferase n=1 Tax=Advenella incenata TaxID=267800 RepID=A0A4Q7VSC2_9BURK|nr:serine O-acetyltransferase EpsC [Advenella incenata]RZT99369.1 serine O-acetyltransferase [Advenella incenata]